MKPASEIPGETREEVLLADCLKLEMDVSQAVLSLKGNSQA